MNTPIFSRVINRITLTDGDTINRATTRTAEAKFSIPGWSQPAHYLFFEAVAHELHDGANALICGVYHGLDLSLFTRASRQAGKRISLTGVDLFSSAPCADWTDEQRARGTWEANGFGPPPSSEAARLNAPGAVVIGSDAVAFMEQSPMLFDFIYLDTSHDEATVRREIAAARRILAPDGLIAGDDYASIAPGWGVDRAVSAALPQHAALWNRIWISPNL